MTDNQSTAQRISDLIDRLGRLVRSQEQADGLNPAQWEALRFLARANRFSRSPGALAEFLGSTKGTASQTVQALERKGLLRREREAADKRAIRLTLTPTGQAHLRRDPLQAFSDAAATLATQAQNDLSAGLEAFLGHMQRRNGRRPFGQCSRCRFFRCQGAAGQSGGPHRCALLDAVLSDADGALICIEQEEAPAPAA
jgi:DNA-binding MarR family transcriptional regulator